MSRTRWVVAALALGTTTCGQAILTAPPGSTIVLTANPEKIPAFGGVSVISAFVLEATGTPVADGTVVQFFTTLGTIAEQGKTNDGVARVQLLANGRSGEAKVTGYSGGGGASGTPTAGNTVALSAQASAASGECKVQIGSITAKQVRVSVDPVRLVSPQRDAEVVATVYDDDGNPLSGVGVTFIVTEGTGTDPAKFESLDSGGAPVYTDHNGRAYDRLRTRYSATAAVRWVTVTAYIYASGGGELKGSSLVQIN